MINLGPGWGPYGPIRALMGPYGPFLMGPYGPLWALMGPCGPIWALMGPPGQVLAGPISTFGPISHVSGSKVGF